MKINIMTTLYNTNVDWLKECIESVRNQTYQDYTHILVNDGSTDIKLLNYLEELKNDDKIIIINHEKNMGIAHGRNTVIRNLDDDCQYIAILDSDDQMINNRLEIQLEYMQRNNKCDILGGQITGLITTNHPSIITDSIFMTSLWFMNNSTLMIRRKVFDIVGEYSTKTEIIKNGIEDYEFLSRCYIHNLQMHNLQIALTIYRVHSNQITKNRQSDVMKHLNDIRDFALKNKKRV